MKLFFKGLLEQCKTANAATKALLVAALLVIVGIVGFSSWKAANPHFKLLYSGLDASHAAAIQSALAAGNVRYEVSQPPSPFVIHVDESQYYAAQNLVALSSALETIPEGIQTNDHGASQVFLSAPERAQGVLKREWQELEKQLEELDFVARAHVSTSTPDASPLRRGAAMTVAVTLAIRGRAELSTDQANTVAKLVRYRFNVPQENVIVSDQSGKSLFDGSLSDDREQGGSDLFEHKTRHDRDLAQRTNEVLDRVFGAGMAYVVVNSDWTQDETETIKEKLDKPVVLSKTESKTETPQGSPSPAAGGATGTANLADFGTNNAAVPATSTASTASTAAAKTSDVKTSYVAGKETEHKKSTAPTLKRLSISLFLDESLKDKLSSLESSVKTSVGFDGDVRKDSFSSMVTAFASVARDEQGKLIPPPAKPEVSEPNHWVDLLIKRGVEILCALAFLFVLLRALRTSPGKSKAAEAAAQSAAQEDPLFLEQLARTQIEELVRSEPERVSTILSRWAADEDLAKSAR